jgi:drug/metabolite transporter (DMT)-like permease
MSAGWVFLGAMVGAYGLANMLQSKAAARTAAHETLDPKLLVRLARQNVYLIGILCQIVGFVLAFAARAELPLFLVQAAVAAGLGVTAILGVLFLKWRLPRSEIALLATLLVGLGCMVFAAQPHPSRPLGPVGVLALMAALGGIAVAGFFAVRLHGAKGSVALGALAGIAFGAAAVASRPLANISTAQAFFADPLLYLLIAHSVVGQLLLGLAMQRGSTTAAVAAMDAAAAIPAAVIGLLFLGDKIAPGREWFAAAGFVVTLSAVIGLTFYAEPQHHHQRVPVAVPTVAAATAGRTRATRARPAPAGAGGTGSGSRIKPSRALRAGQVRARARRARGSGRTAAVRWTDR